MKNLSRNIEYLFIVTIILVATGKHLYALGEINSKISLGVFHSCAMDSSNIKCWGRNSYGQLGNNHRASESKTSQDVEKLKAIMTNVGVGVYHTCARTKTGIIKCWGRGNYGQLGIGNSNSSKLPRNVKGLKSGVRELGVGQITNCVRDRDKNILCWGNNYFGQAGNGAEYNGETRNEKVPVKVQNKTYEATAKDVRKLALVSHRYSCAIDSDNELWCWGDSKGSGSKKLVSCTYVKIFPTPTVDNTGIRRSLLGYYPLDGDALDYSGYNNHAKEIDFSGPDVYYAPGLFFKKAFYSQNTRMIRLPDLVDLNMQLGFTESFWLKGGCHRWERPITFNDFCLPNPTLTMMFGPYDTNTVSTGALRTMFHNVETSIGNFYYCGVWKHYSIVYDSTTVKLYINGVLVYTKSGYAPVNGSRIHNYLSGTPCNANLGADGDYHRTVGGDGGSTGMIQEVALWNRALTQEEVQELYNNGNGLSLIQ